MEELEKILFVKVFLKKIKIEDKGKNLNRGIFERLDKFISEFCIYISCKDNVVLFYGIGLFKFV